MPEAKEKKSLFFRFVKLVETGGNKLPHPMYIYLILIAIVFVASFLCSKLGVTVTYDALDRTTGELTETTLQAVNLFSKDSLQLVLTNFVTAYDTLAVIASVIVITIFIAIPEKTGFFSAGLRKALLNAPPAVATFALSVAGVCCNIMSDAGQVLAASLGAVIFKSLGRNPWLGIIVGYGAAAAGFTANLIPANTDILIGTITNQISAPLGVEVNPLCNYYFMIVATFFIAAGITLVCEKVLVKMFPDKKASQIADRNATSEFALTPEENRGLKYAGIAFSVYAVILLALTVPHNAFFRNEAGELIPKSPFISSLVAIICLAFLVLGVSYGIGSGVIKKADDVPKLMADGARGLAGMLVNFFPIAIFIYVFSLSNLSSILAVAGEHLLTGIGLTGLPLIFVFIIFMGVTELFMYGGSSRWAIFAPIFVPMMMNMGIHPALTQLAYRLGDSWTGNIAPTNSCLLIALALMSQYRDPELNPTEPGMGTLLSGQIPISLVTLVVMCVLVAVFTLTGIPLGPGI